jgi:flagellar hook-associated protein 2
MGTTGPLVFTGISTYSSDFQSILTRQDSIEQLPIKALQNQESTNLSKKQALIAINPAVANVASAVAALGTLASNQGVSISSSDSSTVSVLNIGATASASYTISNIQSLAAVASETSVAGYSNTTTTPVSISGHVDLLVGSNTYHLDLTNSNNLNGLSDAINNAGAGANASILTIGSNNYLSVSTSSPGATTLQLNDVPLDLVSNTGSGTETSTKTYADQTIAPVSANGLVDLVVGSTTYHLNVTGSNNLTGLMNAINGAGAPGVSASITGSAGSYSLALAGPVGTLKLNDLPSQVDLISNSNQGTNATFKLNNVPVTRSTNVISDIIPGVSFTLLKTNTNTSTTVSLTTDPSQLSNALQTLVTNYNAMVDQVAQQVGTAAGPLGGDTLIREMSDDLRQLTSYWNTSASSIHSLSDLGVTFEDQTSGHLSFDQNTFNALSSTQISDAFKFLGSSNSGFAALASNFTQLSDPVSGMIIDQENGYDTTNQSLTDQINTLNDSATLVHNSMAARLQAADALVAQLQSQQNMVNASISSLNYVLYGKQTNSNGL